MAARKRPDVDPMPPPLTDVERECFRRLGAHLCAPDFERRDAVLACSRDYETARELWEALAARGLIPDDWVDDPARCFFAPSLRDRSGTPTSKVDAETMAMNVPGVLRAESAARDFAALREAIHGIPSPRAIGWAFASSRAVSAWNSFDHAEQDLDAQATLAVVRAHRPGDGTPRPTPSPRELRRQELDALGDRSRGQLARRAVGLAALDQRCQDALASLAQGLRESPHERFIERSALYLHVQAVTVRALWYDEARRLDLPLRASRLQAEGSGPLTFGHFSNPFAPHLDVADTGQLLYGVDFAMRCVLLFGPQHS